MGGHLIDITGNEYNYLRVLGFSHIHNRESYWRCQCKRCGRIDHAYTNAYEEAEEELRKEAENGK